MTLIEHKAREEEKVSSSLRMCLKRLVGQAYYFGTDGLWLFTDQYRSLLGTFLQNR